ncbi:hypothetical protein ACWGR4_01355 [Embleya sp. NPDC055664]|uniref:hypothetical protein n=1 Tax=Embleya sp. NPDC059237 TaxID=3346784 RepID=UPI003696AB9C
MNDRDLFALMLDQPEPDFPSVVDAAVAGGKRIRRRRRVAALGAGVGVLVIAGTGLFLTPSQQATVRPGTDVRPAATTGATETARPNPAVDAPASAQPASAAPESAGDRPTAQAETRQERTPPETQPRSGGRTTPPTTTLEDERKAKCLAVKGVKC